jgi:tRNA pseudouridine55 synthase
MHHLQIEQCIDGLVVVRVLVSAGFYVRSLAHDLGQKVGCGAHLETLRRVRAGAFTESDSVMLSTVEGEGIGAAARILPLERLLPDMPAVVLSERDRERAMHGGDVPSDVTSHVPGAGPTRRRLVDASGHLVAVAELRPSGLLHPVIVLV